MNLYNYHSEPESLEGHKDRRAVVKELLLSDIRSGKELTTMQREKMLSDPDLTVSYAIAIDGDLPPYLDKVVSADDDLAYRYASVKLQYGGNISPRIEKSILKDPKKAGKLARFWAKANQGEPIPKRYRESIAKDAETALDFIMYDLKWNSKSPDDDMKKSIATNAETSLAFAQRTGRFPLGEPAILKDHEVATKYVLNVLQDKWPEGEAEGIFDHEADRISYNLMLHRKGYDRDDHHNKRSEMEMKNKAEANEFVDSWNSHERT